MVEGLDSAPALTEHGFPDHASLIEGDSSMNAEITHVFQHHVRIPR